MVRDNQVVVYDEASEVRRRHLATRSWGAYVRTPSPLLSRLGYPFRKGSLSLAFSPRTRVADEERIKVSIVIPSRNRRDLVMEALSTIVPQSYSNWECVVFDNFSDEPIEELVKELGDERIRVVRSEKFLPVTESWNRAIDCATGDYVCLLGDDDGLTPDYMDVIAFIVRAHDRPDFIYNSLFQFFHPGVAPWEPSGYVIDLRSGKFFEKEPDFFKLNPAFAVEAVRNSLEFKRSFAFNMQAFCFDREFLNSLRKDGKVFHSPFPDYYLANVAFAAGKQITIASKPISIAGVSRKSFGFTLFNKQEAEGRALLATKLDADPLYSEVEDAILPGPEYNTNYLLTMAHVVARLGVFAPAQPLIQRYRNLQIVSNIFPDAKLNVPVTLPDAFLAMLSGDEKIWVAEVMELGSRAANEPSALDGLTKLRAETEMYGPPPTVFPIDVGSFADLPELYAAMAQGKVSATII